MKTNEMKTSTRYFLFIFLAALFALPSFANGDNRKRLLIINSYHDGAPWAQDIINPVLSDISKRNDFYAPEVVYLSNTLIHNDQDFDKMERALFRRFADKKPDYLVLLGNFAFTLRDKIVEAWGDVPILMICQSQDYGSRQFYYTYTDSTQACEDLRPLKELQGKYNFSIVHIPNLYKPTIEMMIHMFPNMSRIVLIADALYINRHMNHEIKDYMEAEHPDIEYQWLVASDSSSERLQKYLNNRDNNIGLLLSTWFYERFTIHGYPELIAGDAHLIKSVKHPVFGLRYAYFSYGIVGGVFPSPDEFQEDLNAGLADLISGKDMRKVPFRVVGKEVPIINYRKLEGSEISAGVCPPDTVFLNRPKTVWEEYYMAIIFGGIAVLALTVVAIVVLFYQRRRIEMLADRDRIVGNMPIGYSQATVKRDAEGNVMDVDFHGWNEMFGNMLKNNEMPDRTSKLFDSKYPSEFVGGLIDGNRIMRFSHHFEHTDTDYEFLANFVREESANVDELDIFAIDITDQKKKEVMLIEAREKAMESDNLKMAFLANMSHEIRTPLNSIVGFSRLLSKTTDAKKRERFVEIIDINNELLLQLIGDVLDTAKIESNTLDVHMEKTDINTVIHGADSIVSLRLPEGVELVHEIPMPECEMITDPSRVRQVLVNFLTNACKFTKDGSITVGYEIRGDEIYFYVKDTGMGIARSDMSQLFTRFTKLNKFVQGTGLGLSICKSIVERLGGKIGAESEGPGMGSLFWFTLPYPGQL